MKLTNKLNLPRSIENAVRNDPYNKGDAHISVTGLIGPARKRAIEIQHADEITEDVSDRIWALIGQVGHGILERADDTGWCEERLFIERHGWRISGSFDRYCLEQIAIANRKLFCLDDYKFTSSYSVANGIKPEWEAQLNIYALMLREHGYKVEYQRIVAILRDWQKSKAKHTKEYPQQAVAVLPVEMWKRDRTEQYIKERLIAHGNAQHKLPECSPEERWEKPATYAILKRGASKAVSLHSSTTEAVEALKAQPAATSGAYSMSERPAEQRRCQDYCNAFPFCIQGQKLVEATQNFRLSKMWNVNVRIPVSTPPTPPKEEPRHGFR